MCDKVKCTYSNCNHDDKELPINEAVLVGKSSYYHRDCHKQSEEIKQIIDLFKTYIDPLVVYSQLKSVINNILFQKFVSSEYLLFALNYAINNKINLKHAMGLHYIIGYKNIQEAYKKLKAESIKYSITNNINMQNDVEFTYKCPDNKGFGSVLKGGS
jgi:hypothetical protein